MRKKSITSKLIIGLGLVIPIIYGCFLSLAAPACAAASAVIEGIVAEAFFPKTSFLIPLLIVVAFELTKLFLALLDGLHQAKHYQVTYHRGVRLLYGALVSFSLISTLLFSLYSLHNPNFHNSLAEKTKQISAGYEKQFMEIKGRYTSDWEHTQAACEKEKEQVSLTYQEKINYWLGRMKEEEAYRDETGNFRGKRWNSHKANYDEAVEKRDNAVATVHCKTEDVVVARNEEMKRLSKDKATALLTAEEKLLVSHESANPFIATPLLMISRAIGKDGYSFGAYLIIIIFMSLLISVCLELIIWVAAHFLATHHGHRFGAAMTRNKLKEIVTDNIETQQHIDEMKFNAEKERILNNKKQIDDTLKEMHNKMN